MNLAHAAPGASGFARTDGLCMICASSSADAAGGVLCQGCNDSEARRRKPASGRRPSDAREEIEPSPWGENRTRAIEDGVV